MVQSFMTSGSLTWCAELNEGPDRSDMAPFPEENIIMTVCEGPPLDEEVPHVQPRPQDPNSLWLGPRELKYVTTQVLFPVVIRPGILWPQICYPAAQILNRFNKF
jgi:hypothetical protein